MDSIDYQYKPLACTCSHSISRCVMNYLKCREIWNIVLKSLRDFFKLFLFRPQS